MIPEEIKKQIEDGAHEKYNVLLNKSDAVWNANQLVLHCRNSFITGGEFAYSLTSKAKSEEIESWKESKESWEHIANEKAKEIEELKKEMSARNGYYENKIEMLIRINSESSNETKEIERLKGLIEAIWKGNFPHHPVGIMQQMWQQFKTENQL